MAATAGVTFFSAFLPGGPLVGARFVQALIVSLLLLIAVTVAGRRDWPLSVRRALFFFLLLALLVLGASLLPGEVLGPARPGLLIAAQILGWVGLAECAQALLVDLILVGGLKRPPVPRILRDFVTLALALTVFMLSLRGTLGVNLSSLLATSAMISVVLGLALQDTLGSFFAGLALQMEAPLAIGDWVQIDEHQGQVSQVSWRTVRIVSMEGDEFTFPNSLVTRSTLVNFSRPTTAHLSFVAVRIPYRHPPNQVIAALVESMKNTPGVLADPPAHALVWDFDESQIVYRARYWIGDYRRVNYIRSDVGARLWYGLRRSGIENAFPVRLLRRETPGDDRGEPVSAAMLGVDIFNPLTAAERDSLASCLRLAAFGRGEEIIRQGEQGDSLFVILRGQVEVRVASGGQEEVVDTLGAGSFFGEMSLLTGAPRSATVRAIDDVQVVPVTVAAFRQVVAENPAVLEAVTGVVSRRRSRLDEAIHEAETEAAARSAAHRELLERVRAFFGV
ncbi:MAG: cyclic nucleotide-binding domain-containing protein [Candidatus Methylomirabilia bacterium]